MKEKEITGIIEDRFKTINKLRPRILKDFNADDIHDFRVEIKKLRAFLRLMDVQQKMEGPLIPLLLKTFYGYIGIIRNIQVHKHRLFKYITDYTLEKPAAYIKLLDDEEDYWKKQAEDLMAGNDFQDEEEKTGKEKAGKLEKQSIKKFVENKLEELKEELKKINDETALHNMRKILKDLLYIWHYIKDHADLPNAISSEEQLRSIAKTLGDFRDMCIQLEFLEPEYLDKIKDENEKALLNGIKNEWQHEKELAKQQLCYSLNALQEQLGIE